MTELSWIETDINGKKFDTKTFINPGKEIDGVYALAEFCEKVNKVKYIVTYSSEKAGVFYKIVNQYRATPIRRENFPPISALEAICYKYDKFPKKLTLTNIIEILVFDTLYYKTVIPDLTTEKNTLLIYQAFMKLKSKYDLTSYPAIILEKKHYHADVKLNIRYKHDKKVSSSLVGCNLFSSLYL